MPPKTRVCTVCKKRKRWEDFHKDSQKSSGIRPDCKECVRKRLRERSQTAEYRDYKKKYDLEHRDVISAGKRRRYHAEPEKHRKQSLASYKKHREQRLKDFKATYKAKRDRYIADAKRWSLKNKTKVRQIKTRYKERKRATSPVFVLAERCSKRVRNAVAAQGYRKNSKTEEILGCSWSHFKRHIESLFKPGMTWKNRDQWQLDHHIPVAAARTIHWLEVFNHWSNWKPMWTKENLSKSDRLPEVVLVPRVPWQTHLGE